MKAKARVVLVRTTLVMSRKRGALGPLMPLLKLGLAALSDPASSSGLGLTWSMKPQRLFTC